LTASYTIIGTIGCLPGLMSKPAGSMPARQKRVLSSSLSRKRGAALQQVEHRERRADDAGRQGVAEQIGARALAQQLHHLLARCGEAAAGAAQRLAEGAGDDVDLPKHAAVLGRAAAGLAQEAGGMAFVDAQQRAVRSQSARISFSCAIVPSIENTPSVNTSVCARPWPAPPAAALQVGHVVVGVT
jgi:hypothetical protein